MKNAIVSAGVRRYCSRYCRSDVYSHASNIMKVTLVGPTLPPVSSDVNAFPWIQ